MQTSLTSRLYYSLHRGFTLAELLISVGIIAAVSTVVLVNFSAFDSTVLLKGEAYEIALSLRESQVKSVGMVRNSGGFDYPYGMSFTAGSSLYQAFVYKSATGEPKYELCSNGDTNCAELILENDMGRSMIIKEICYVNNGGSCVNLNRLDISFRRPEFGGLFYGLNNGGQSANLSNASLVRITLGSSRTEAGTNTFVVEVSKLGQISVYNE